MSASHPPGVLKRDKAGQDTAAGPALPEEQGGPGLRTGNDARKSWKTWYFSWGLPKQAQSNELLKK